MLDVPGLRYLGLYGMGETTSEPTAAVASRVGSVAAEVAEAWVEDKGVSIAVHYRQAPDPSAARATLVAALREIAGSAGFELVEGKMVVELVPAGRSGKGGAVERLVAQHGLSAVMFAGDDVADLDAFAALDRLAAEGLVAVKVAVDGPETPDPLLASADVRVGGPEGLVDLLRQLV
jgi:trehalose 6-phosphate phosphatase